jgi:hypothetical protein
LNIPHHLFNCFSHSVKKDEEKTLAEPPKNHSKQQADPSLAYFYENRPRANWQTWLVLLVAILFTGVSFTTDPELNCTDSGECAAWVVYVIRTFSVILLVGVGWRFLVNHPYGSAIDLSEDSLIWWSAGRAHPNPQRHGKIRAQDIKSIEYEVGDGDGKFSKVYLFNQADECQLDFTIELIHDLHEWLAVISDHWPHIDMIEVDQMPLKRLFSKGGNPTSRKK